MGLLAVRQLAPRITLPLGQYSRRSRDRRFGGAAGSLPGGGFGPARRRNQRDGGSDRQRADGPPKRILADADVTKRAYQRHHEKTPIKPVLHQPDSQVNAKHRADGYPSP